MFYSHQLLARKAPLGQIWMAATMHAKINRRKLDQINIIRICEEILNPSVPMALRLSGILMGGVVIVYERKVRLLYDDVNRLLIEINSAWKVAPAVDPTVLPKGKTQAKFEAVTLPENQDIDLGDVEQSIEYSSKHTTTGFQQSAYFAMRLDTIDELNESFMQSLRDKEPNDEHQADMANITLDDTFDVHQADTGPYNRFERFDIEGDEETQFNIPSQEHTRIPVTPVHSPPPAMQPQEDEILVQQEEKEMDQSPAEDTKQQPKGGLKQPGHPRKRARKPPAFLMDEEQTMIPINLYQSWLQDSSSISARRPKVRKVSPISIMKLTKLIELPPVALSCGLVGRDYSIYYPQPLLQLWLTSIQSPSDSPSGRAISPKPPEPSSSSPLSRGDQYQGPPEFPMGDFEAAIGSDRVHPQEKLRSNQVTGTELPFSDLNLSGAGSTDPKAQMGSSGAHSRPSSIPEPDFSNTSDSTSGRLNKKRPSSSRLNSIGLEILDENNPWIDETAQRNFPVMKEEAGPSFKIPRQLRPNPTPEEELLVQTVGPTQTQRPFIDEETETLTRDVTVHLKTYFDTPGAPQTESLDQLAYGMDRKQAAQLFYQTCVLATRNILKVEQKSAYGEITISRGAKM